MPTSLVALTVPALSWATVEVGGIQVSQFLPVPSPSYLISDGVLPGLTGVTDGALVHLAGTSVTGDQGANWLQWRATSTVPADQVTIFDPWPPSAPQAGRWHSLLPPVLGVTRIVTSGAQIQLTATTSFVRVAKVQPSLTTVFLPNMLDVVFANRLGEDIRIKTDLNAASYPVTVTTLDGSKIDDVFIDVLNQAHQERVYTPDGVKWNRG